MVLVNWVKDEGVSKRQDGKERIASTCARTNHESLRFFEGYSNNQHCNCIGRP